MPNTTEVPRISENSKNQNFYLMNALLNLEEQIRNRDLEKSETLIQEVLSKSSIRQERDLLTSFRQIQVDAQVLIQTLIQTHNTFSEEAKKALQNLQSSLQNAL